jgi:hypothetical protein
MVFVPLPIAPEIPVGILADHEITAPEVAEDKFTKEVPEPEHIVWSGLENDTVGLGLIVML